MRVKGTVRRIGNSLGVIIPKEEVKRHGISEGDLVELDVERRTNLREIFGSLKFSQGTQALKDEARGGWGRADER